MRKPRRSTGSDAFSAWLAFAKTFTEMAGAAAEVVAHRTRRIALAGANPSAGDRREFALMGREKVDAAAYSAFNVGMAVSQINQRATMQAWLAMLAVSTAAMSMAGSRTTSQALARQSKLIATLRRIDLSGAALSSATASVAKAALKPIHARATSNAIRLRRR